MNIAQFPRAGGGRQRIAIIGSGISGAAAAWALRDTADITLYEAASRPGGHTATVEVDYDGVDIPVDTGFIVYNELNYPELVNLFDHLGVATHESCMGFSLSLDGGRLEWSGHDLRSIFAQKRNVFSPTFLWMLREILRFNRQCVADRRSGLLGAASIGDYLRFRRFSKAFCDNYLIPMAAAIWSTPRIAMLDYPAEAFITFFENHRLVHAERPQWRTVTGGSRSYLAKLLKPLAGHIRLATPVEAVIRDPLGATVCAAGCEPERFDAVILACHSDQALGMLADPSHEEQAILSSIPFRPNRVVLHRDARLMPRRRAAWASWNYLRSERDREESDVCVTYWMNRLQGIDEKYPLFVSLNPSVEPRAECVFGEWSFEHPQFDRQGLAAQQKLADIQGRRHSFFAGAWTSYGFHENGLVSGLDAAMALGGRVPWRQPGEAPALLAAE